MHIIEMKLAGHMNKGDVPAYFATVQCTLHISGVSKTMPGIIRYEHDNGHRVTIKATGKHSYKSPLKRNQ
jgi:hypothetical protein